MIIIKKCIKLFSKLFVLYSNKGPYIYLTFDDGPIDCNTPKLLDVLLKYNIKATFFMVGSEIENYPDIAKRIYSEGHTIGYHSYDHKHIKGQGFLDIYSDLARANEIERSYDINFNKLYRPPYGELTVVACLALIFRGWKIVLWSKDSYDFDYKNVDVIAELSVENIANGEIILLHDDYCNTSLVMESVLPYFKQHNIECRSL